MKMLILGDVCPTAQTDPLFAKMDMDALFGDYLPTVSGHGSVIANLECALTDSDHKIKKFGPNLKACRETAQVLKALGVTCCGLSNNHIFDYGIPGYRDTVAALEEAGIDYTGFGQDHEGSRKNYYIEKDGKRICVIAVCEHEYSYALPDRMGSRPFDPFDTLEDIRRAKQEADRVIVLYHGGKELCRYPSPRLLKACRSMVRAGADLVTCQHSHCIGCYENYEGGHILYGQGNFHFVKFVANASDCWDTGLSISYDADANTVRFIPHRITDNGITLAHGEEAAGIMDEMDKRNAALADGSWLDGWRAFCEENRELYTSVITKAMTGDSTAGQNHHFAHYLDCEAHLDVWRELFPTANMTNET